MNYYIQGDAAKADKIRAAFEKLGYDTTGHLFNAKSVLYFTLDGGIRATTCNCTPAIIKTHPDYKELELPAKAKFKVGDWVVKKDGETFYGGNYAEQITLIEVEEGDKRIWFSSTTWLWENDIRLWTIQDAKDGDVLVCYSEVKGNPIEQAGIFKQYVGRHGGCSNTFLAHTGIDWDGNIIINGYMGSTNILPATKEQRDLLFAKMREAGYEWDAEKKELRKIKPHYDIANFQPFDRVLVRQDDSCTWGASFFGRYAGMFMCCNNACFIQCIPYNDDTKHLLGTTDPCDEQYINW